VQGILQETLERKGKEGTEIVECFGATVPRWLPSVSGWSHYVRNDVFPRYFLRDPSHNVRCYYYQLTCYITGCRE
jgi:hypothetical protein